MPFGDSRTTTPSIAVLGTDAVIAALPATPVQLAHACLLAGYDHVVPASWGDELLATECLRELDARGPVPAIQCSCPRVAARLLRLGADLAPLIVSLVPPPVAVARYLRTHFGDTRVRITYVGRCPAGSDPAFDAHFAPGELLDRLAEHGIDPIDQPTAFDSVIPPDRRRFVSLPGGVPTADAVHALGGGRALVELTALSVDQLAQRLLGGDPVLVDLAPAADCDCAGGERAGARAAVAMHEPPRARTPILEAQPTLALALPLPHAARDAVDIVSTPPISVPVPPPERPAESPGIAAADAPRIRDDLRSRDEPISLGRRRLQSPPAGVRPIMGSAPTARSEGRILPRAYVARRRHSGEPRTDPAGVLPPSTGATPPASRAADAPARAEPPATPTAVSPPGAPRPSEQRVAHPVAAPANPGAERAERVPQSRLQTAAAEEARVAPLSPDRQPSPSPAPPPLAQTGERAVARPPVARADDSVGAPTTDSILATPPSASPALRSTAAPPRRASAVAPAKPPVPAEREATLVLGSRAFIGLLAGVVIVGIVLGLVAARVLASAARPAAAATALHADTAALAPAPLVTSAADSSTSAADSSARDSTVVDSATVTASDSSAAADSLATQPGRTATPAATPPAIAPPSSRTTSARDRTVTRIERGTADVGTRRTRPPPAVVTDSAARQAARDSLAPLEIEREQIRREIERRRARLDSLLRARDSVPR